MKFVRACFCFCLGVGLLSTFSAAADMTSDTASKYGTFVKPFLTRYCIKCHGAEKSEADLRVDTLESNAFSSKSMSHWVDIMDRVNGGAMPPEGALQPTADDVSSLADWITELLTAADAEAKAGLREPVSFRRLSREEYRNTIRDLLGVTVDVADPAGLPEDPDWLGFERIGSVLTVSPAHIEKYLAAAETALKEALPEGPEPKRETIHWDPFFLRGGFAWGWKEKSFQARGIADKVRVDITPNNSSYGLAGGNHSLKINTTGEYICRVKLSGLRPVSGAPPRLSVYSANLGRTLFERDVETPEDKPETFEFRVHLPADNHLIRIFNAVPGLNADDHASQPGFMRCYTDLRRRQPWQVKLTDDDFKPRVPFLLLDYVEWEGPVFNSWPTIAHQQLFESRPVGKKNTDAARQILTEFAQRAFRRSVSAAEIDGFIRLFERSREEGTTFQQSVRTSLLAVLCSPNFVYLVEGNARQPARALTDWELASRLSYFLWSTMPDDRLISLAKEGNLHERAVLQAEARRMLHDPRITAFVNSFPRQWLQLRRLGMFKPDPQIYPDYDDYLEKSLIGESTAFFQEVLTRNLGLTEFLDSDWTMLNRRVANHYGLVDVEGEEFRRVALRSDDHRGGLLTQAAILGLTSDGTRHRPVHRGKWILESIIGKAVPPPPANVPAIATSASNQPKTSLRAKLEAHRDDANCRACHRKIDPLGLAFDNYDAIGRWRTEEVVLDGSGTNPPIDASGALPDGRHFHGAAELKKLLVANVDKFAAGFTEKLATYALRRGMSFTDRVELKRVVEQSQADGYRLESLVETLITSDLFQKR